MKKYTVYITETVDYSVEVEAENEDSAVELAEALREQGETEFIGVADVHFEAQEYSECSDCGAKVPEILGCPDGAEVCPDCEHKH